MPTTAIGRANRMARSMKYHGMTRPKTKLTLTIQIQIEMTIVRHMTTEVLARILFQEANVFSSSIFEMVSSRRVLGT